MNIRLAALGAAFLLLVSGCATLKSWFTPQGRLLEAAQNLLDQGQPLGASALAVEALALDADYKEARELLARSFAAGQQQYRTDVPKWSEGKAADRWDKLVQLHRWQRTLADQGAAAGLPPVEVDRPALREAELQAAARHLALSRQLRDASAGPRQARKALAEARTAETFAPDAPGLDDWLPEVAEAATQRLLVIPFFFEAGWKLGAVSGPLGTEISRRLMDEPGLPELTSVFPSDRLITLPGGGLARLGLVSQPDAVKLAHAAGQNLVLLGQLNRVQWTEPRRTVRTEARTRTAVLVTPDKPAGVPIVWKATVTFATWTTSVQVGATFSVVETETGRDLLTAAREAKVEDSALAVSYTGDQEALTPDDLAKLGGRPDLTDPEVLRDQALGRLAAQVADAVRQALR